MAPGILLAVDGVDGAGKDTQLAKLMAYLRETYPERESLLVKAPYDKGIGGILRRIALGQPVAGYELVHRELHDVETGRPYTASNMVFTSPFSEGIVPDALVSRWLLFTEYLNTYRTVVAPALARGAIVVNNRSHFTSNYAYGVAMGVPLEELEPVIAMQEFYTRLPDRIVVLDLPADVAQARLAKRADAGGEITHYDTVDAGVFGIRRGAYHYLATQRWPEIIRVVHAEGTPDDVFPRVLSAMEDLLPAKEGALCAC